MAEPDEKNDPPAQQGPNKGGIEAGARNRKKAEERPTTPLAPEAQGGAGAGRKWPGDS